MAIKDDFAGGDDFTSPPCAPYRLAGQDRAVVVEQLWEPGQDKSKQDKSEQAWLDGAVICEFDDCQDQAVFERDGKAACDWHTSIPDRQAMMPRKPASDVREGDLVVIDNLDSRVVDSQPWEDDRWLLELNDDRTLKVYRNRPVAVWDPKYLTRGAP